MQLLTRDGTVNHEIRGASGYLPWGDSTPPPVGTLGGTAAGVQINEGTALQLAAVFGSVDLISDSIATLPMKVLKVAEGQPAQALPVLPTIIADPYSLVSPIDFKVQGTSSVLLRGNFFGKVISRNKTTQLPEQVMPIPPDRVQVRQQQNGTWEWRYYGQLVNPADVTIMRGLSMAGAILGQDPISAMRNQFGLARAQDLFAGAFFANQAQPYGVIKVPGELSTEGTLELARGWMQNHQGIGQAYLPAVLTGGAEWEQVTITPQNAQFLEQMQFSASVISGMIFRVPPHMLGMVDKDTSWGAGIEQQEQGFVTNCLLGKIQRWEYLLSSWLPPNQLAVVDLSQRLRGDSLQRWSVYQIGRVIGAINNLEIRHLENMPVIDDPIINADLADFNKPLNSAPVKPTSTGGAGGDHAD